MKNKNNFQPTFNYKLIYVFRIPDKKHEGLLKIGDTTIHTDKNKDELIPNCKELNEAANKRIQTYTKTASISYELLYTEIAIYKKDDKYQAFKDSKVHEVLIRSGINKHIFEDKNQGREWFKVNIEKVKSAIQAVKKGRRSLDSNDTNQYQETLLLRPEQEEAVKKTLKQFKNNNKMLWNAKMRFGKTLTSLEVAKRLSAKKTLIFTHRPVVNKGWFEDFHKVFSNTNYEFGSKKHGENIKKLINSDRPFVYFVSIQDLRGSSKVGGKFDKNEEIFSVKWDFIIIDEAHEGTQTELGESVSNMLVLDRKNEIKQLQLSGTPFNIISEFNQEEIYTWDYIMEQTAKRDWALSHFGDSNPYEDLPQLEIFTYDLDQSISGFIDPKDNVFNFREFFRVYTSNSEEDIPSNARIGDFVHKDKVKAFLNLLTTKDDSANLPFSNDKYCSYYKHTLWMVPGVKEAKALSALMREHIVFGNEQFFKIINVAGDGDEETNYKDALQAVQDGIGDNPDDHYTITISCGRLTAGVSVPEWSAVLMLSGSSKTSSSNYLQTIFRVQTPANINGKIKEFCSVFDFAPDRALKMVVEAVNISAEAGYVGNDENIMKEFLKFCPVIAINGSKMKEYDVNILLQQLKKVYVERVVMSGFEDRKIYNDNLLKLDDIDLKEFEDLKKIIGVSKQAKKAKEIVVNDMGFSDEEYRLIKIIENKPKKDRSPEEIAMLEEKRKKAENARRAMSILRGISIRIPLMIYGAEISIDENISVDNFTDLIDDVSWEEFMPRGVTKDKYKKFSKYYEKDIFIASGRKIRNMTKYADTLAPAERIKEIAEIFSTFKNPDKETVLTPWRVVNMHLSDCIGGYNFYNEDFTDTLSAPIYVDRGDVTADIFNNPNVKVLEINSKTGLYPLYMAYSIYSNKVNNLQSKSIDETTLQNLWMDTISKNIFVICKTPMAKSITKRTLLGYRQGQINAHAFDDLINQLRNKPEQFRNKILKGKTWNQKEQEMKFDAIVGNPPYQEMTNGAQAQAVPLYHLFVNITKKLNSHYISLIIPARWFTGGFGLNSFRNNMLRDTNLKVLHDYQDARECFENVEIKGGIVYFLWDKQHNGTCEINTHENKAIVSISKRLLLESDIDVFIRYNEAISILQKVKSFKEESFMNLVSSQKPFGIPTNFKNYHETPKDSDIKVYGNKFIGYLDKSYPLLKNIDLIHKYKIFTPKAVGNGKSDDILKPILAHPNSVCTETYVAIGPFENEVISKNVMSYIQTKFFHFLLILKKNTQDCLAGSFVFIPIQDFNESWSDVKLYLKYNFTKKEIEIINRMVNKNVGT